MTKLKIALGQIAPVWLNKSKTIDKINSCISDAGNAGAQLIAFGEALLPGYPFWSELTGGAVFNSAIQKAWYGHYVDQAVSPTDGDLESIQQNCKQNNIAAYIGTIEKAKDRGGHSLYCSLIYIDNLGEIKSIHRKLCPTYEERLNWSPGDGNGLVVHPLGDFTVGGLNCWENWMPLVRSSLYGQGENLHVAVWPGSYRNTHDITPFIAKESRSYVVSVSSLMRKSDIPTDIPNLALEEMISNSPEALTDGGSCIAAPDGSWVVEPIVDQEGVFYGDIDINKVYEERQNLDVSGHYSRPDVTQLTVNRTRQSVLNLKD